MAPHWVMCLLGTVMLISPSVGLRYAIMASEVVRPGQTAGVHISLYSPNLESSRVLVEFRQSTRMLFSMEYTVSHKFGRFIEIPVPDDITSYYCKMTVTGLGNFTFTGYRTYQSIRVDMSSIGGFIQTDKGMYNPGNLAPFSGGSSTTTTTEMASQNIVLVFFSLEKVRYRVLFLDPELKTYKGKLDITIKDPAKNLIKKDVGVSKDSGLIEGMLQLSEEPLLGEWTIVVEAKGLTTKTKTFDVRQYAWRTPGHMNIPSTTRAQFGAIGSYVVINDRPNGGIFVKLISMSLDIDTGSTTSFSLTVRLLPRFEVSIVPTKSYFSNRDDDSITGVVKAKYSSGKPLKGQLQLTVKAKYWSKYMTIKGVRYDTQPTIQETLSVDGESQFSFNKSQLEGLTSYLHHQTIIIQASVVEDLTGEIMNATANVKVYPYDEKAEFMSFNPTSYKPGLQYEGNLRIVQQDDRPLESYTKNVTIVVRYKYLYKAPPPIVYTTPAGYTGPPYPTPPPPTTTPSYYDYYGHYGAYGFYRPPRTEWATLTTIQQSVPSNGVVNYKIPTHKDAVSLTVQVRYGAAVRTATLEPFKSSGNAFLRINLLTGQPEVGKQVDVRLESNIEFSTFTYAFITKGRLLNAYKVTRNAPVSVTTLSFNARIEMAPTTRLVIFTADGNEIIPDAISFNVKGSYSQQVSVDFDATEVKPGEKVNLTVRAKAGSWAASLIVDKSVIQLKPGFDLSPVQISDFLTSLDVGTSSSPTYNYRRKRSPMWWYPTYGDAQDARDLIKEAGLKFLTDGLVYVYTPPPNHYGYPMPGRTFAMYEMAPTTNGQMKLPDVRPELAQVDRIRSRFLETWLWGMTWIGDSGKAVIPLVAPDSFTTWVATAFVVNEEYGFGITESPSKIVVLKKFYVNVILPYSVIRGEEIVLQANVFNYHDIGVEAHVELHESDDFDCLDIDDAGAVIVSKCLKQIIHVKANSATSVFFPIVPKSLGEMNLTVTARAACTSDGLTKSMIVEPEGIATEYNLAVIVDLLDPNMTSFEETLPITFPPNLVEGSARVAVDVLGNVLTKTLAGLSRLIRMSYGCGEQNIANFAPTVFVSNFLDSLGELKEEMRRKATDYIAKGYQQQMKYMRRDGSFSAFGDRDNSGSTWLTIFAVKTFIEARNYISIDEARLQAAVRYIEYHTNEDGTIREDGRVLHTRLQGGSASGVGLTAYALSALSQHSDFNGLFSYSLPYLESRILNLTDPYLIAISAYALELSYSNILPQVRQKLMDTAITEDGLMYWESHSAVKSRYYWEPPKVQAPAASIEATGYGLLACLLGQSFSNCLPAVKWLIGQQNSLGGYVSTQDTVVAIKALAEAAKLFGNSNDMNIGITSGGQTQNFVVTNGNQFVLQSAILQGKPDQVVVRGTGSGQAIVQVSVRYNVKDEPVEPSFALNLTVTEESSSAFTLRICSSYLLGGSSDMAYIDVQIPTGFTPADDTESKLKYVGKRAEVSDKKVILYVDEITTDDLFCFSVKAKRSGLVSKAKPVTVTVLDYYNPDNQVVAFYLPESLKGGDFCDVCDTTSCGMCSRKRKK